MKDLANDLDLLKRFDWDRVASDPEWQREHLAMHLMFESILNVEDVDGWSVHSLSLREKGLFFNLVVKATHDGIPLVAFVTDKRPTGCIVVFGRLWLEGRVKWYPDKFA